MSLGRTLGEVLFKGFGTEEGIVLPPTSVPFTSVPEFFSLGNI